MHWDLADRWRTASVLEAIAGLRRDPQLLGAAAALRKELGTPVPPAERVQYDEDVKAIGIAESTTPLEDAVAIALSVSATASQARFRP